MDKLAEMIWQRGSAWQIMKEARNRWRTAARKDYIAAHVALASAHHSLVKRYRTLLGWPLALWHISRAVLNVNRAAAYRHRSFGRPFTTDEVDVVARVWARAPSWLGGNAVRAKWLIGDALTRPGPVKPHTHALLLLTLGDIEYRLKNADKAWACYRVAEEYVLAIELEESEDRERQLVRLLSTLGFFYLDHSGGQKRLDGLMFIRRAALLAKRVSADQEKEILAGMRKRGIKTKF